MKPKFLVQGAIIASLYALITLAVAPISSGLMQLRISEAMAVLPYFTLAAVPGLFVGCLVSNLLLGAALPDIIFGSLSTLLAAFITFKLKGYLRPSLARCFAPLSAVLINALVIGWLLFDIYKVGSPFWVCAMYVALGQALVCYGLGVPLLLLLERYKESLNL